MLKIFKVHCFSCQTYHKHQLIPVVLKKWREEQEQLVEKLSNLEGRVVLSGDGRSDSPGHSAKYGAFNVIEQMVNKVLDVELIQVSLFNFKPIGSHCSNYSICQLIRTMYLILLKFF